MCAASEVEARNFATGEKMRSTPAKGRKAPFRLTSARGAMRPSSVIFARMAAPAEWPTAKRGSTCNGRSNPATRPPMPGKDMPAPAAFGVKPWPGRSGAITVKRAASSGSRSRHECVDAPVPCSSSSAGPSPIVCTCQRRPPASTNRLALRFGQSAPSRCQSRPAGIGVSARARPARWRCEPPPRATPPRHAAAAGSAHPWPRPIRAPADAAAARCR